MDLNKKKNGIESTINLLEKEDILIPIGKKSIFDDKITYIKPNLNLDTLFSYGLNLNNLEEMYSRDIRYEKLIYSLNFLDKILKNIINNSKYDGTNSNILKILNDENSFIKNINPNFDAFLSDISEYISLCGSLLRFNLKFQVNINQDFVITSADYDGVLYLDNQIIFYDVKRYIPNDINEQNLEKKLIRKLNEHMKQKVIKKNLTKPFILILNIDEIIIFENYKNKRIEQKIMINKIYKIFRKLLDSEDKIKNKKYENLLGIFIPSFFLSIKNKRIQFIGHSIEIMNEKTKHKEILINFITHIEKSKKSKKKILY